MAEIAGVICSALSCICGTPTCNLIDQYRNFNDDVAKLRRELACLTGRKQDIELQIQVKANGGQMVQEVVQKWLKHVQEIDVDVQAFLQKVQRNKWYKRACLDKVVCRKINEVKEMLEKGSFPQGLVIERPPAPGLIFPTEDLEGSTKDEIWKYLMGNRVGMIGVCGIGGIGKTTIMQHINNDLVRLIKEKKNNDLVREGQDRFQKVIWVVVSHPLVEFELQTKIVDAMHETLREKEEMRRAAELMEIMGRESFVLILDDVWEKFSLKKVGIPKPTVQNDCKVVITSRSVDVCNSLGCKIVKVQPLSTKESLKLFLDKVGHDVLQKVPGVEETLISIVKECGGLPLAIVVIAGTMMKGKDKIEQWRNALTELRQCVESLTGEEDQIFGPLKFSYDRLANSKIQKCFLYSSLFQEDHQYFRKELIEDWIDEGLIDTLGSRQAAYDRGHAIFERLRQNCLLEEYLGNAIVKMHDVVRDMAIRCICPGYGYMAKAGMKLKKVPTESEWVGDLKKVSLAANGISEIPIGLTPRCPLLSTLILSYNPNLSEIPSSFFEDMVGLKVLDLSGTGVEALPDSICNLVNLSALRLRRCRRLKYLPSLVKLRALKKLDLHEAGIELVHEDMKMLVSLEYLDLFCQNLTQIPTGILPSLSSLQYLVVYGKITKRINLEEVARLSKLESLECGMEGIQDFNYLVNKSKDFESLTAYDLRLTTGNYSFLDEYQRKVLIAGCEIGEECIVLPRNLEQLWINQCKNMTNMRCSLNKVVLLENATELRSCSVEESKGIECLVELDSSSSSWCCSVLDKLEQLNLSGLPNLSVLVRVEGVSTPPQIFSNLKILKISRCSGMRNLFPLEGVATPPHIFSNLKQLYISVCFGIRNLFPLELWHALQNLEEIHVRECKPIEEIIASSDSDASSDKFTFPKLRILSLWYMDQLKSICSGKGVMVCDCIEVIQIWRCRGLKRIPLQLPLLDNGEPSPPPCLKKIEIDDKSKEWWESVVEFDHPKAKNILQPFLTFRKLP